jgi:hypothetical protein
MNEGNTLIVAYAFNFCPFFYTAQDECNAFDMGESCRHPPPEVDTVTSGERKGVIFDTAFAVPECCQGSPDKFDHTECKKQIKQRDGIGIGIRTCFLLKKVSKIPKVKKYTPPLIQAQHVVLVSGEV